MIIWRNLWVQLLAIRVFPPRKSRTLSITAPLIVMQDVYNDPRSGENIEPSRDISNHIIRFTFNIPLHDKHLLVGVVL